MDYKQSILITLNNNLQTGLKISRTSKWIKFTKNGVFTSSLTVVCRSEQKSAQKSDYIWYKKMTQRWSKMICLNDINLTIKSTTAFKLDTMCLSIVSEISKIFGVTEPWFIEISKPLWCDCMSLEISKPFGGWLHEPWNFKALRWVTAWALKFQRLSVWLILNWHF